MIEQKNIVNVFLKYVCLNILGQMAYACYTMADTFFVSARLGTIGLTALNLAFPLFCVMSGTGLMIGIGGGSRYAILKSQGRQLEANHIFTSAVYLVAGFSVFYFLMGACLSEKLVRILGADDTVFQVTNIYLKTLLLFGPAFLMNTLLQCFVRNDGNPSLSTRAMTVGSFSNIILDFIFIFPMKMGIFGAAFATGLSPLISMLTLMPHFMKKKQKFHFSGKLRKIHEIPGVVSRGFSPFLTEASSGIVMFLFNYLILRLEGNVGVAAFGVVSVISLVVVAMYTGLSQGMQPLLSENYGRRNKKHVKAVLRYGMITMAIMSLVIYAGLFFFASEVSFVFNSERDMILQGFAIEGIRLYFLACPFIGFNIVLSTYFVATDRPYPAQLLSLLRSLVILIPVAFCMARLLEMIGVWCAYPLTEMVVSVIGIYIFLREKKNRRSY